MNKLYSTIIEPIITEKSTFVKQDNKYVFKVHLKASKVDIKNAVEKLFKAKVKKVNIANFSGKERIIGWMRGRTPSYKKAYVTLAEGQTIEELNV